MIQRQKYSGILKYADSFKKICLKFDTLPLLTRFLLQSINFSFRLNTSNHRPTIIYRLAREMTNLFREDDVFLGY